MNVSLTFYDFRITFYKLPMKYQPWHFFWGPKVTPFGRDETSKFVDFINTVETSFVGTQSLKQPLLGGGGSNPDDLLEEGDQTSRYRVPRPMVIDMGPILQPYELPWSSLKKVTCESECVRKNLLTYTFKSGNLIPWTRKNESTSGCRGGLTCLSKRTGNLTLLTRFNYYEYRVRRL